MQERINKFAEARANGDDDLAKSYVSTAYFLFAVICLFIISLYLLVNPYLNWQKILNTDAVSANELGISERTLYRKIKEYGIE